MGGVVLPLIPIGFGIGLTLPVFLLAVQDEVAPRDVGEASGLVQFLPSLGGSIRLSVLASFARARFAVLDPPPASGCAAPTSFRAPTCVSFLAGFPSDQMTAYDAAFTVMLGLLALAFVAALFHRGRFTKTGRPKIGDELPPAT